MSIIKKRLCQPCTACCDGWLQNVVDGVSISPGKPCPHSKLGGCNNYENRPTDPCRGFECAWISDENLLPEWMKPNNSKVIVLLNQGSWNGFPIDVGVPVGKKIPGRAVHWLKEFSKKFSRCVLYTEQLVAGGQFTNSQSVYVIGPEDFKIEIQEKLANGIPLF